MSKGSVVKIVTALFLATTSGMVAASSDETITIPTPRAGEVHVLGPHTWAWGHEVLEIEDGMGIPREVVALDQNGVVRFVTLDGGVTVAAGSTRQDDTATDTSHLRSRQTAQEAGTSHPRHGYVTLGLMGKTLAPGDVVTTTPGHDWNGRYVAVGWENIEGTRLFRVEVEHYFFNQVYRTTFWYDGEQPVPSRALWWGNELRLLTAVEGDPDAPRLVATRPAVPQASTHVDASWVALTPDGPMEPMRSEFTLQEAVGAFLESSQDWFAEHPDAYLVEGLYDVKNFVVARDLAEPAVTGTPTHYSWELTYADATEGLTAEILKAATPDSAPSLVSAWNSLGVARVPFSSFAGRQVACGEHAGRAALEAAEGRVPDVLSGGFRWGYSLDVQDGCFVHHATKGQDLSYSPQDQGVTDSWDTQSAAVDPFTGRVLWSRTGTATSEFSLVTEEDGKNQNGCSDLRDNDGDGRIDDLDSGCRAWGDESTDAGCWDSYNNDGDIYPDWPLDPDCESPWDWDERN